MLWNASGDVRSTWQAVDALKAGFEYLVYSCTASSLQAAGIDNLFSIFVKLINLCTYRQESIFPKTILDKGLKFYNIMGKMLSLQVDCLGLISSTPYGFPSPTSSDL